MTLLQLARGLPMPGITSRGKKHFPRVPSFWVCQDLKVPDESPSIPQPGDVSPHTGSLGILREQSW